MHHQKMTKIWQLVILSYSFPIPNLWMLWTIWYIFNRRAKSPTIWLFCDMRIQQNLTRHFFAWLRITYFQFFLAQDLWVLEVRGFDLIPDLQISSQVPWLLGNNPIHWVHLKISSFLMNKVDDFQCRNQRVLLLRKTNLLNFLIWFKEYNQ